MGTLRLVRLVTWGAVALLTVGLGIMILQPGPATVSGVALVGGPFRLASHDGGTVDSESLKGRPFAVFFGFTNCPDVCPTAMLEIANDLNAVGAAAAKFPVFFITVDPERDTAAQLKTYISSFDARITGLIPRDDQELHVVTKAYRAIYRKVPTSSGYTMDHTASMYLMDGKGQFFGTLDSRETEKSRQEKLRRLIAKG